MSLDKKRKRKKNEKKKRRRKNEAEKVDEKQERFDRSSFRAIVISKANFISNPLGYKAPSHFLLLKTEHTQDRLHFKPKKKKPKKKERRKKKKEKKRIYTSMATKYVSLYLCNSLPLSFIHQKL